MTSLTLIAFGYLIAHYFSLFVFRGVGLSTAALSAAAIWYVQVTAIVGGHVGGVVLAHDRAVGFFPSPQDALASQRWMLVVMVGLTCVGLYLLSAVGT